MLERLSQNIEGRKIWKGPDIATSEDVILGTGPRPIGIPITIFPNSLPSLAGLPIEVLKNVHSSVRSRFAQSGVDLHDSAAYPVALSILRDRHQDLDGNIRNPFESFVVVYNRGQRPIKVPKDTPFFRFFVEMPGSSLRDNELLRFIEDRKIAIDGEFNKDWGYSYYDTDGETHIDGIYVRIEDARYWIPPSENNKPLEIDPYVEDYRPIVSKLFAPIPKVREEILWIGQTVKVSISGELEAVLDKFVAHDINKVDFKRAGLQINSRLLDGGRTNWPVRVEVLSSTLPEIPNFAHFRFVKNGYN